MRLSVSAFCALIGVICWPVYSDTEYEKFHEPDDFVVDPQSLMCEQNLVGVKCFLIDKNSIDNEAQEELRMLGELAAMGGKCFLIDKNGIDAEVQEEINRLDALSVYTLDDFTVAGNQTSTALTHYDSGIPKMLQSLFVAGSALMFLFIEHIQNDRCSASLLNSCITGIGSNYFYFSRDATFSQKVTGEAHPISIMETFLPLLVYGYAGYEVIDSLQNRGWVFVIHGSMIYVLCTVTFLYDRIHILSDSMIVEISSIFYSLRKVDRRFMLPFILTFFAYRWTIIPYETAQLTSKVLTEDYRNDSDYIVYPVFIGSAFLANALNLFWSYKIIRLALRGWRKK